MPHKPVLCELIAEKGSISLANRRNDINQVKHNCPFVNFNQLQTSIRLIFIEEGFKIVFKLAFGRNTIMCMISESYEEKDRYMVV